LFAHINFTAEDLFVYLLSFLENAINSQYEKGGKGRLILDKTGEKYYD